MVSFFQANSLGQVTILFGIASALLSTIAFAPYIRDTFTRRTKPVRSSWLIWSVLSAIAFASQFHEGATASLWYAGVQAGGTIFVFVLSLFLGMGRFLSSEDVIVLLIAGFALIIWYFTSNAAYALTISIGISLLGGSVTIRKAYLDPARETMFMWAASLVASLLAIGSVGAFDPVLLAYPVYLLVLNAGIVFAIILGRARRRDLLNTLLARHGSAPITRPNIPVFHSSAHLMEQVPHAEISAFEPERPYL